MFKHVMLMAALAATLGSAHAGIQEMTEQMKKSPAMRTHVLANVKFSDFRLQETAVPGLYRATHPSTGRTGFIVHEGIDYIKDSSGWYAVTGGDFAPVTPEETHRLDLELIAKTLPLDQMITYTFGKGERKILVWDAFDCSHCRDYEAALKKYGKQYNATVYIMPTALQKTPDNARLVRSIWCSKDNGELWRNLMTSPNFSAPNSDTSTCDKQHRLEYSDEVAEFLGAHGTPAFVDLNNPSGRTVVSGFEINAQAAQQKSRLDSFMATR